MNMKVLYISRRFYPEVIGGGQISGLYIAKAVKQQGNDVQVITFSNEAKTHNIEGIKINALKIPTLNLFPRLSNMEFMYFQMAKLSSPIIEKYDPDIIHLLNFETIPLAAIYYKKRFKKKIVATVNGPLFGCFTQSAIDYKGDTCIHCRVLKRYKCSIDKWGRFKGSLYYLYSLYYMKMLKKSYEYVDKFFAVSNAMVPLLTNMDVNSKKVRVVHNPIEIKKKVKTSLKKRLGIKGRRVILYAGRLNETKGIQYGIVSLRDIGNVVFLVVGHKRDYYTKLVELAKMNGVEKKVLFVGYVDKGQMAEYYSIADVALLPGEFYEPFSRFLLESCSYGVPMIASDRGGNRDIVKDSETGYLIKEIAAENAVSNSIKKILSDKEMQSKMSQNCLLKAKEFTMEKIGQATVSEYKST